MMYDSTRRTICSNGNALIEEGWQSRGILAFAIELRIAGGEETGMEHAIGYDTIKYTTHLEVE